MTRLDWFQPNWLVSGFAGLVKFGVGWWLVGLVGYFFKFYQKNLKIWAVFVKNWAGFRKFGVAGKFGWF